MKSTTVLVLSAVFGAAVGFAPTPARRPSTSLSFFGNNGNKSSGSSRSSPLADEAVGIYTDKLLNRGGRSKFFFEEWGVPAGARSTPYAGAPQPNAKAETDTIFARDAKDLTDTFNALASIYGDEEALAMVKIQPNVLSFTRTNFAPALEAFGEKFGYDESKEMIQRNPGLLATTPVAAEASDDLTMKMSYVIDVTRPLGKAGPITIALLLMIPVIEGVTGVTRGDLLASLLGGGAAL